MQLLRAETKNSGASYIIASNLILDHCWFPESNKCQGFYEGRKQIRGQGLGSRPQGSLISEPDKVKPKGHALSFLESQLEKMPILKPLSLKRLTEETQRCPREYCKKPDVSAPPMTPPLTTRPTLQRPPRSHRKELESLGIGGN